MRSALQQAFPGRDLEGADTHCPLCLERITDPAYFQLPCGHAYYNACVNSPRATKPATWPPAHLFWHRNKEDPPIHLLSLVHPPRRIHLPPHGGCTMILHVHSAGKTTMMNEAIAPLLHTTGQLLSTLAAHATPQSWSCYRISNRHGVPASASIFAFTIWTDGA